MIMRCADAFQIDPFATADLDDDQSTAHLSPLWEAVSDIVDG